MLRKILVRSLLVGTGLAGLLVVATVVAGLLAFRQPAFYASRRSQKIADPRLQAEVEAKIRDFENWCRVSTARPNRRDEASAEPATFTFDLSETQLNSMFAAEQLSAGAVGNPRVRIRDGTLRLGAEIRVGNSTLVFSMLLKPLIHANGQLKLEITSASLGSLPFPLHSLLNLLAKHESLSDPRFDLDLSGRTPVVTIHTHKHRQRSPRIESVRCAEGRIAIRFAAAKPPQQLTERHPGTKDREADVGMGMAITDAHDDPHSGTGR